MRGPQNRKKGSMTDAQKARRKVKIQNPSKDAIMRFEYFNIFISEAVPSPALLLLSNPQIHLTIGLVTPAFSPIKMNILVSKCFVLFCF